MLPPLRTLLSKKLKQRFKEKARASLRREGYDRLFTEDAAEAIKPDFADLFILQQTLMKSRPKLVIEYGSGYTTYLISETLRRIGGRLISVELIPEWRDTTAKRVHGFQNVELASPSPSFEIRKLNATVGVDWYGRDSADSKVGVVTIVFPALHSLKPDLILLDGPDPRPFKELKDSVTDEDLPALVADPLVFEKSHPPVICVDGRRTQSAFVAANLQTPYRHDIRRMQGYTILWPS